MVVVSNVVDSSMAREADGALYTRAGPEVGVAATKTHLTQIVALEMLALHLGRARGTVPEHTVDEVMGQMRELPTQLERGPAADQGRRRGGRGRRRSPRLLLPGSQHRTSHGARGSPQAEGDLLPAGRGVPGRGAEARSDRVDRTGHRRGGRGPPRSGLGEDVLDRPGGQEPGRDHRGRRRRSTTSRRPSSPTTRCGCRRSRRYSPRWSTPCRCSSSPTGWRRCTVTTSTVPATWPRRSPSSSSSAVAGSAGERTAIRRRSVRR